MGRISRSFSSHENHIGTRCTKSFSNDVDKFSYNSVNDWRSTGIVSTLRGLDESKGACKKKKKKGKLNKLHSQIISSSGPSDMSCLEEISMGIESINPKTDDLQSKIELPNSKEGDHLSKVLIYKSIPVQVETKYNYSCSHFTVSQVGERDLNNTGVECSPIVVPMQDYNQLDESSNLKATWNQYSNTDVTTVSTASSSSASSTPMWSYSEETIGLEKILADGDQIVPGQSNCRKNEICNTLQTTSKLVTECNSCMDDRDRKFLSMMSCVAASMISRNIVSEITLRAEKDYKYCKNKKIKPEEEFMPSYMPAIKVKQYDPKEGYFQSFYGKSQMLSSINNQRQQNMENAQFFRQRVRRNVACLQSEGVKVFNDCHLMANDMSLTATSPKSTRYKGDGLLPSPQYHCAYKHVYVPLKVPQLLTELNSNDQYSQLESGFRVADDLRAVIWRKSENKLQQHLRSSINHHKRRLRAREGHAHEVKCRPSLFLEVSPEFFREGYLHSCHLQKIDSRGTHTSHLLEDTECISQGYGPYLGFSPYGSHELSAMQDATGEAFFASQNGRIPSYSCSERELLLNSNVKDCITSLGNSLKPIHTSFLPDNREDGDDNFLRKEEYQTKTGSATSCGEDLGDFNTGAINFENGEQGIFVSGHKDGCITKGYEVRKSSMYAGSTWAEQVLVAAYKLQRDSCYVELMTGSPIASFEKFLTSVSPVIFPSFSINEERDFFFTVQDPSVALRCIWSWYEKPGCYGLEVKAGDSHNFGRLKSLNEPFLAYFVPSLSAIQLFGYSHRSRNRGTIETVHQKEETENCLLPSSFLNHLCPRSLTDTNDHFLLNPVEKHSSLVHSIYEVDSSNCSNGNRYSSCVSSAGESKLIFEFFENDLPHERLSLYAKALNKLALVSFPWQSKEAYKGWCFQPAFVWQCVRPRMHEIAGSSSLIMLEYLLYQLVKLTNPLIFQYSVAWYPIYRIPDGPFRMTFLTYHSLGHFTLNPSRSCSSKQDVVCPVLGMLSYNAKNCHLFSETSQRLQNKGWFILNKKAQNSLHKGERSLDVSKLLQDRISNLMETAAVFETGHTNMNNVKVQHVHRDYNFFLLRQQ
ncbi:hypothetical protein IEQ34_002513 [Dendrobium chrysotoxum]|uniref:Uncharacterized protein n=1 Tax=Dendrobium chrysotoxum TaxID=161865 RepID=A0AAV7HKW0_DENCH|nr:hypothetical protein IEQ34_002513 [Dendrobium chrysotoxum]